MFDYQKVRLIAVTKPVSEEFISDDSSESFISYCARVSNPENQSNFDTASKLLNYCVKNNHWSIFEMANMVLEIETTRDIGRQMLRHRSFSFQEFSQRYAKVDPSMFLIRGREGRLQDKKNRQNSILGDETQDILFKHQCMSVLDLAVINYEAALNKGIAKEQARALLPEGLTMSRMYMNGNIRSWITYCMIRDGNGTQKEHIDIAQKCKKILLNEFPALVGVFEQGTT